MYAITRSVDEVLDATTTAKLDLNDVARGDGTLFVRDGVGVAGRGTAARIAADTASDRLAGCEHDSTVESHGPIAIGAVPFRPGTASDLLVPEVVVRKSGVCPTTITVVGTGPEHARRLLSEAVAWLGSDESTAPPTPTAGSFTIDPAVPIDRYLAAVATARDSVRAGDLVKAVIARPITVSSDQPIDVHAVLRRLRASFGSSYRYSIDGLIGASPELLIEVDGDIVRSHPLAGTAPRTGDAANDAVLAAELIASTKNQIEHRVVIDVVHDTLLPWSSYLDWEPEPSIVTVANVQHLGTRMEGRLSQPGPSVIELVRALSPTPALGGAPRDEAVALIERVEGFDRGRYGGAVGWVDARGNGTWAVAIRCAELSDDRRSARLVAGGGIVADSDPLSELAETQAKFQAMLSAIVRP
ncbi:MAG: isochorismate synthase [Ilumatobacteraceae bacterium]